ncbi:BREX-3 system P-loop-containing protein BrxF [Enterobacter hormaechei]|uniref:BREX-3 system P-loop-containing protein BrxF n=1 Tax=Enterobacter hormaechei TaxID=158836 RepID=UPI002E2A2C18|nr:BREX-3 system P-loop-containing protein BrxF [Enterobacter hormaechei]MED5634000.1 BREX-3 system P-loop-containing protein BrxF [Enterobacter hormaechei]
MTGQNIHTTIVSSTYGLLTETNSAILRLCDQASSLVLIVNSTEQAIEPSQHSEEITLLELSEKLCEHLLPLSRDDRSRKAPDILAKMLNCIVSEVVWVDRIQVLFEPSLELDPLRQLQELARIKPIIAIWPGQLTEQLLTFSVPGRADYQSYTANELANLPIIHFVEQREYK